jgi:hypothetical protein
MSQKPSADLHSGQALGDLLKSSISPKLNLSPELFRIMARFIPYAILHVSFKKLLASGMV